MTVVMLLLAGTFHAQLADDEPRTRLRILVPDDAFVFVQKERMKATGGERVVESPTLTAGQRYTYEISVIHAGTEVSREVSFEPGQTLDIDFRPDFARTPSPPPVPTWKPLRPEWLPRRAWRA
ncbi:MAG: hypothetical protein U0840_18370 [Gemmataceae bacterium]